MNSSIPSVWIELNEHLRAFVAKKIQNEEAAKDLVQDVFVKVQSNWHTLNDKQKINSWIFQITRNTINDYYRNRKKSFLDLPAEESAALPFTKDETHELSKCMLPMIDMLPEKYSEALKLSDIEGISQKELAERLQISYSGAKSRVQRGREKLREVFLQCCEISTDKYGNVIEYHQKKCSDDC